MTKNQIFSAARQFQLWSYVVSHRQLLLRSPKAAGLPTRLEILFKDVSLICIGITFDNLSIQEIERGSPDLPIDASYVPDGHRLFRLSTNTTAGYVAAAAFFSSEDEKEYYDDSALVAPEHL
jgi:hypothetical protein